MLSLPRVSTALRPRQAGLFSFPPFPPRPQARQTNRGPRRATMPACRPLHGNKPANAGQQFSQPRHRRRANYFTQVFWAIAVHTSWVGWPIDRPQTRCFFWLLFFSAEKKSDEPRPAGRGTRPAGRPPAPAGAKPAPQAQATRGKRKARAAGASHARQAQSPRGKRKARARRRKPRGRRKARAAGAKPARQAQSPRPQAQSPRGRRKARARRRKARAAGAKPAPQAQSPRPQAQGSKGGPSPLNTPSQ